MEKFDRKQYKNFLEVANLIGVSQPTVRRWHYRDRKFKVIKRMGRRLFIPNSEVERIAKDYNRTEIIK